MTNLEQILDISRFVTMTKQRNFVIVESNCWPQEEAKHTVNIRGKAASITEAIEDLYKNMREANIL